jgi:uncharacterized protein YbaP (TraB family)
MGAETRPGRAPFARGEDGGRNRLPIPVRHAENCDRDRSPRGSVVARALPAARVHLAWRSLAVAALAIALVPVAMATGETFGEGHLWRISKPGIADSYVLGTIHVADPRIATIPRPVLDALARTRLLAMELIPEAVDDGSLLEQERFDDGRRLEPLLGAGDYAKVRAELAAQVPERTIERMKPWAALLRISRAAPSGDTRSLDEQLFNAARARRMRITSLEWIDEQVAAFDTIPLESQVALLKHVLAHRDAVAAEKETAVDAWLRGDLAALARVDEQVDAHYPGMGVHYRQLRVHIIEGRTVLMHHRLFMPLRAGGVFVAIGASHLDGEQGLLAMLEEDGFRVSRLW